MAKKTLILTRHAHRDTSDRAADNGLSPKGRAQARALEERFAEEYPGRKGNAFLVLSSPKRRCVETVRGIARRAGRGVKISQLLTEQGEGESSRELEARVRKFVEWWKTQAPPRTLICSHGDWLPLALRSLTGAAADMKKGGWAEVVLETGGRRLSQPLLKALLQPPVDSGE